MKHRGLRRVQVFRLAFSDDAPAEPDDTPAAVANGENDAVAEQPGLSRDRGEGVALGVRRVDLKAQRGSRDRVTLGDDRNLD